MTITSTFQGKTRGKAEVNSAYITATANDTTTPVNGNAIDNIDGRVNFISANLNATNQTGTNPTLQLILQGSHDGTNWATLNNQSGSAMQSSATSISTASTTAVNVEVDSQGSLRTAFPPWLRFQVAVGGTGSPGGTYTVATMVLRDKYTHVSI